MEMAYPEGDDFIEFFLAEDADAMGRSEQTVSDNHIRKIFKAFVFAKPLFKGMFEYMCGNFHNRGKLLEGPLCKSIDDGLYELVEDIEEGDI